MKRIIFEMPDSSKVYLTEEGYLVPSDGCRVWFEPNIRNTSPDPLTSSWEQYRDSDLAPYYRLRELVRSREVSTVDYNNVYKGTLGCTCTEYRLNHGMVDAVGPLVAHLVGEDREKVLMEMDRLADQAVKSQPTERYVRFDEIKLDHAIESKIGRWRPKDID